MYDICRIFNKMHFRNVSNHYECSINCTLGMLVMNVFNHFGGLVYNICRIIFKMHFWNELVRNVFNDLSGIIYDICWIFIKMHFMNGFYHKEC